MGIELSVRIKRIAEVPNDGTYGVLILGGIPICVTLELNRLGNAPNISCIPAGTYLCKRIQSPKHGNTFEVTGVPARSNIEFHGVNTVKDLLGCIGIAEFYTRINGRIGVANPVKGAAMAEFLEATKDVDHFTLLITEHLT